MPLGACATGAAPRSLEAGPAAPARHRGALWNGGPGAFSDSLTGRSVMGITRTFLSQAYSAAVL